MYLAVATPEQMEKFDDGKPWKWLDVSRMTPSAIRHLIYDLIQEEEDAFDASLEPGAPEYDESCEYHWVTLNRTVLDRVSYQDIKNPGPIGYDEVYMWMDDQQALVPLLELHHEDYLVHSAFGDLVDRWL